jgi:hypothetical protein
MRKDPGLGVKSSDFPLQRHGPAGICSNKCRSVCSGSPHSHMSRASSAFQRQANTLPKHSTPLPLKFDFVISICAFSEPCGYTTPSRVVRTHRTLFNLGGGLDINCELRIYLLEADGQITEAHHYNHANTRTRVSQTPGSFLITLSSEYSHPVAPTVLWNLLFTVLFIQLF